jgi:hypothetical protein
MLMGVFQKLDRWIDEENQIRHEDGLLLYPSCEIKVVGQTALIEAKIDLALRATVDVDVFANYDFLDPVGHEAWMPKETQYTIFFEGTWVKAYLAKPEYIILSKAKKAPDKNRNLIIEYLASSPSKSFFKLAEAYQIDLSRF